MDHVVLHNVSWGFYELLLRETAEQHVRVTYDRGRMVLQSGLSPVHQRTKKISGRLVEMATLERDIAIRSFGSTTWKRQDLAKGLEADECYYIQHEPIVRGRTDVDLKKDPPPDLAIEIDITHNPLDRASIYAALGVREVWRSNGKQFEFLVRLESGKYEAIARSAALPFMTPEIVDRFVGLMLADENAGLRAFREWLRTEASG